MKATLFSSSISANLGNSGEAMVEIHKYSVKQWRRDQLATTSIIHTSRGETLHYLYTSSREGSCIVDLSTSGEERHCCSYNPWPAGAACTANVQFYHVTVRRMTKTFVQRCQSIYVYSLCVNEVLMYVCVHEVVVYMYVCKYDMCMYCR